MKILLFEWLTSGGQWMQLPPIESAEGQPSMVSPSPANADSDSPQSSFNRGTSLSQQGHAMLSAIVGDFLEAGIEVTTLVDQRAEFFDHPKLKKVSVGSAAELKQKLVESAEKANHVMLIAPECDSCLLACIDWLGPMQHKLISPDAEFVKIASCKQTTIRRLQSAEFDLFPDGVLVSNFLSGSKRFNHPGSQVVLKPIDGAGSENVHLISDWDNSQCDNSAAFADARRKLMEPLRHVWQNNPEGFRIEAFIPGTPVSVSILCGARDSQILTPTIQIFDKEPFGEYVRAETNVAPDISLRAIQLATKAVNALPKTRGYIGLDMVISDRSSDHDVLIEVNPRLTLSYLQLREIYPELAMTMFKKAVEAKKK